MERKRINRLKVKLAEKRMTNKQLSGILDKVPAVISKWGLMSPAKCRNVHPIIKDIGCECR